MMSDEKILTRVCAFADDAHGDQRRKYTPERYIVHPMRVMETCKTYGGNLPMLAAALLHDVLEDTSVSEVEMGQFLRSIMDGTRAQETLALVVELTDVYVKSAFPHLNRRQRKAREIERMKTISAAAQTIKYADIIDNCLEIVRHDTGFAPVFLQECRQLLDGMDKGDTDLRQKAQTAVSAGLQTLYETKRKKIKLIK